VLVPASRCHCGFVSSGPSVVLFVLFVSLFDSPGFLLTSLSCLSLFVFRTVSRFRGELAAVEADGAYSHPAAFDADVARLDVALSNPGFRAAFRSFRAEVVRLKFHLRSTLNALGFWSR
jgi:hypothetical protein